MLTLERMIHSLQKLGLNKGDCVLVHSSFKSMGAIEGGADTVIKAFQTVIGEEGTLVFPTLCSNDWEHVFENWHLDAPSDVGYLTNYFRKLPGALRSNHATHSVAAIGRQAAYITETHGQSGLRYGPFGSAAFSADSPWEKMHALNAKIVMIGTNFNKSTFCHYVEYCFMEDVINRIRTREDFPQLLEKIWTYGKAFDDCIWPMIRGSEVQGVLHERNLLGRCICNNAEVMMVPAQTFCTVSRELLESRYDNILVPLDDKQKEIFDWLKKTGIFEI